MHFKTNKLQPWSPYWDVIIRKHNDTVAGCEHGGGVRWLLHCTKEKEMS